MDLLALRVVVRSSHVIQSFTPFKISPNCRICYHRHQKFKPNEKYKMWSCVCDDLRSLKFNYSLSFTHANRSRVALRFPSTNLFLSDSVPVVVCVTMECRLTNGCGMHTHAHTDNCGENACDIVIKTPPPHTHFPSSSDCFSKAIARHEITISASTCVHRRRIHLFFFCRRPHCWRKFSVILIDHT